MYLAHLSDFGGASPVSIASPTGPVAEESRSWVHPVCLLRHLQTSLTPNLTCSYVLRSQTVAVLDLIFSGVWACMYSAGVVEVIDGLDVEALMCYRAEICENYSSNRGLEDRNQAAKWFIGCV